MSETKPFVPGTFAQHLACPKCGEHLASICADVSGNATFVCTCGGLTGGAFSAISKPTPKKRRPSAKKSA
jgi:hypothetical protein